ncbi:reverse transcriptase domain-containing protein [Tanacetum coccineum]
MKRLILELPTLTTSVLKEVLYVYLVASQDAVNEVLLAERKGKKTPIHYVIQTLHEAERNYAPLEKLALCLLIKQIRRNLDIEGSKTWKDKHHELFTMQYPYVQKIVDAYRLLVDALIKASLDVPPPPADDEAGPSVEKNGDGSAALVSLKVHVTWTSTNAPPKTAS